MRTHCVFDTKLTNCCRVVGLQVAMEAESPTLQPCNAATLQLRTKVHAEGQKLNG